MLSRCLNPSERRSPRGVHASAERKPKAWLLQLLHLLCRFSSPPHTAKRDISCALNLSSGVCALDGLRARRTRAHRENPRATSQTARERHRRPRRRRCRDRTGEKRTAGRDNRRLVEGVHVDRAFSTPSDIGHKALAVNLSDLAAMAAAPRWAVVSLVLPGSWLVSDVEELMDGCVGLARRHGVTIVGGNVTRTPGPLVVDITAGGEVRPRRWLTRDGAKPGDEIVVSGSIGAAAAGLEMLQDDPAAGSRPPSLSAVSASFGETGPVMESTCTARYRRPEPRVRLGLAMGRARAARRGHGSERWARRRAATGGRGQWMRRSRRTRRRCRSIGMRVHWWTEQECRSDSLRRSSAATTMSCCSRCPSVEDVCSARFTNASRLLHSRASASSRRTRTSLIVDRDGRDEELPPGYEHFRERTAKSE